MQLSDRVKQIKPSMTLQISDQAKALKASGVDVISLGTGEPDFDTPDFICQAAHDAIAQGQTRYTAVDGTAALKKAIVNKFKRDNQLQFEQDQILVSSGAKQSLYNLFQALLNDGDEVIIPAPYWVSYPAMAELAGAKPVVVRTLHDNRLKMTAQELTQAISSKTRLVVLNSPSNPCGMAYTVAELKALGEVLSRHPNIVVVSDDIYEHIYWGDEPFHNLLMICPQLKDRFVLINGVSKAYAMTGWRIGYAAGPAPLIKAMKKLQSQSTSNACSVSQAAACSALDGDQQCIEVMLKAFKSRHDWLIDALNHVPGFKALPADGTFYAFPDVQEAISQLSGVEDDVDFCKFLLKEAQVAAVPGAAFGMPGSIRLSFATDLDTLKEAVSRIVRALG